MKAIKLFTMSALATAVFASCSNDEDLAQSSYPADNVVRVTTNVEDITTRAFHTTNTLDEFAFFLIERNVGAVALLAFFRESFPDACARNHIFEITGNAECQLLGFIHILEVMGVARLVKSVVYFVGEFCIIQICFVCFFVWMQSNPFLGENNFFHIFQVFLVICLL